LLQIKGLLRSTFLTFYFRLALHIVLCELRSTPAACFLCARLLCATTISIQEMRASHCSDNRVHRCARSCARSLILGFSQASRFDENVALRSCGTRPAWAAGSATAEASAATAARRILRAAASGSASGATTASVICGCCSCATLRSLLDSGCFRRRDVKEADT